MKNIILASQSIYRKELLSRLALDFKQVASQVDEDSFKLEAESPKVLAETLAYEKAKSVLVLNQESLVIGSDQVLAFSGSILGKAHNYENAFKQLKMMSGKEHQLITSYCLLSSEYKRIHTQVVKLKMRDLSDQAISSYLKRDTPYDCAGSYKIEEAGISLFTLIHCDDYTGIVGLPLIQLSSDLMELGYEIH